MIQFFENHKRNLLILFGLTVVHLVLFGYIFGFRPNNDTGSFVITINFFRGTTTEVHPPRYLNPFYPVVGSTILKSMSPEKAILVINVIFYAIIILLTYDLIRRVFKNNLIGFISALFVMTSYAMLRYGLTQVQDMGGYFWFVVTVYAGWRWYETIEHKYHWLLVGSVATALGILTKESGAMGALFFGLVMVVVNRRSIKTMVTNVGLFAVLPAVTMVINGVRSKDVAFSSWDWFVYNWQTFREFNYTPFKWAAINASTFNFLWILFFIGLYWLIKNRKTVSFEIKLYLLAIIPSSMSYMGWPLFLSRTTVICAWLIVPIAAYALYGIYEKGKKRLTVALLVIALVCPHILQSVLGYTPLFLIIDQTCHYNIKCTVKTFMNSRSSYDDFVLHSENYIVK